MSVVKHIRTHIGEKPIVRKQCYSYLVDMIHGSNVLEPIQEKCHVPVSTVVSIHHIWRVYNIYIKPHTGEKPYPGNSF